MLTDEDTRVTDAAELQNVLTRYIDSYHGYQQAAAGTECDSLAVAFLEIAARRNLIVEKITALICELGEKPDTEGSAEGAIHRWWMRIRVQMTDEELKVNLAECVRGETVLAETIRSTLNHGGLEPHHAKLLANMSAEVKSAIHTFQTALDR